MKNMLLCALLGVSMVCSASEKDTSYWTKSFDFGINFNQAQFSPNWKGGGQNNISLGTNLSGTCNYLKGKNAWDNSLNLQYGLIKFKGQDVVKSADLIFFNSNYGRNLTRTWDAYAGLNFISQFAPGYNYKTATPTLISKFMNPAYFIQSFGLKWKPVKWFDAQLGLVSFRQSFVLDTTLHKNAGAEKNYGVVIGQKVKNEFGFSILANLDKEIAKNVTLKARYFGFYEYSNFINPGGLKHRLDASISAKVTKYINCSITTVALYDKNMDDKLQWSQVLAVGFLYKFKR